MKYGMMPRAMWLLFHNSFEKALETELHQKNGKEIMRKAHKHYKEILADVDEFDSKDRFLVNILSCAMFSGVYLSLPEKPDVDAMTRYYSTAMDVPVMRPFVGRPGSHTRKKLDKTNADMIAEQKHLKAEIQKATQRHEDVLRLYEKIYEDNAAGKVSDEWFMQLSHKYEVELSTMKQNKDNFIAAVRKFMEMDRLTPALLHERIDHIEVHEAQGVGKNRTQHIVIYYRFVGCVGIPECSSHDNYRVDVRQGVAMEYIPKTITA